MTRCGHCPNSDSTVIAVNLDQAVIACRDGFRSDTSNVKSGGLVFRGSGQSDAYTVNVSGPIPNNALPIGQACRGIGVFYNKKDFLGIGPIDTFEKHD